MLSLTRKCDYALVAMAELAHRRQAWVSARDIASAVGVPLPVLTNLLHLLQKAGLVESKKGVRGGYRLGADPTSISLAAMIEAVEGRTQLTLCCSHGHADRDDACGDGADAESSGAESGGAESGGAESSGAESGGAESGGADRGGDVADDDCTLVGSCRLRVPIQRVQRGLWTFLNSVSLSELAFGDEAPVEIGLRSPA